MPVPVYKSYIKSIRSASSLEELNEILGLAIHDKAVNCRSDIDAILVAMDEREKGLGIVRED